MTYFDTAYIVKCYVKEEGWQQVREFARDQERIACSIYGRLELHAALHRKTRENALLRTGDAVHLLTAKQNGLKEILSNDQRLLAAAPAVGIPGRNVIVAG